MKKLDWNRLTPLGIEGRKLKSGLLTAWAVGVGWSLRYVAAYYSAYQALYETVGDAKIRIPDAKMPEFRLLLDGSFTLLGLVALAMVPVAVGLYGYHYMNGRSIYTMKRLRSAGELWRRVLTLPVGTAVLCGMTALVLWGLDYGIYRLFTPAGCLP